MSELAVVLKFEALGVWKRVSQRDARGTQKISTENRSISMRNLKQKAGQLNLDHQLIYRGLSFGGHF